MDAGGAPARSASEEPPQAPHPRREALVVSPAADASAVTAAASEVSELSAVAVVMRELAWVIHRTAPERSGAPVPTAEVAILKEVLDSPGSTVGELASVLGLRQPNVSAALRSLEVRGLVRREKSGSDRRVTRIYLTEQGATEHAEIAAAWSQPLNSGLVSLSEADQRALAAAAPALKRLHQGLRPER